MNVWRVVITDSESMTGVAPVCEEDAAHAGHAAVHEIEGESATGRGPLVFDCCPHPHIETWDEGAARLIAFQLTTAEAEVCS